MKLAGAHVPWEKFPYAEGNLQFAVALGAARSNQFDIAQNAIGRLAAIHQLLVDQNDRYWADQVEIQRRSAAAWLAHVQKNADVAMKQMQAAADLETSTEAHDGLGDIQIASARHERPPRPDHQIRPVDAALERRSRRGKRERDRLSLEDVRRVARVEDPDAVADRLGHAPKRGGEERGVGAGQRVTRERAIALPGEEKQRFVPEQDVVGTRGRRQPGGGRVARLRFTGRVAVKQLRCLLVRPADLSDEK